MLDVQKRPAGRISYRSLTFLSGTVRKSQVILKTDNLGLPFELGRNTLNFIGLGHSHIVALATGAYALQAEGYCAGGAVLRGHFHYLYDPAFEPAFSDLNGHPVLHAALGRIISADDYEFIIVCPGGNEHNILAIAETGPRYDFVPRRDPEASIDPAAWLIPEAAIHQTLRGWMTDSITLLSLIRDATRRPIIAVAPPPPLPRERVLAFPKEFFRSVFDTRKLNSDRIRRKMWLSQIALIEDICSQLKISFVEAPPGIFDEAGMLAETFWGQDASHANDLYGRHMMRHTLDHAAKILVNGG
jgi:hypothetical protein